MISPSAGERAGARLPNVTRSAKSLYADARDLGTFERLQPASELIASVDREPDLGWDAAWLAELDRRLGEAAHPTEPLAE